ncbi:hypothetical protein BDC45DRAFT_603055 [Circinella umbellata]|nr:hypothetical protein BDC45DRAFT_603055 [Circinella umbellata]
MFGEIMLNEKVAEVRLDLDEKEALVANFKKSCERLVLAILFDPFESPLSESPTSFFFCEAVPIQPMSSAAESNHIHYSPCPQTFRHATFVTAELNRRFEVSELESYQLYRLFLSSGPLGRHPFIAAKVFDESLALPRTHMKFAEFLINKKFKIQLYYKDYYARYAKSVSHLLDVKGKRRTDQITHISERSPPDPFN